MKKESISVKGTMGAKAVAALLKDLAASIEAGTVCIMNNDEFATLSPSDPVDLKIKAGEKKGEEKLSVALSWKRETSVPVEEGSLKITSVEPEIKDSEEEKAVDTAPAKAETREVAAKPEAPLAEKKDAPVAKAAAGTVAKEAPAKQKAAVKKAAAPKKTPARKAAPKKAAK